MKLNIRRKLILAVAGVLVAFALLVGILFIGFFSKTSLSIYQGELTDRAQAISTSLTGLITQTANNTSNASSTTHGHGNGNGNGNGEHQGENFGQHSLYLQLIEDAGGANSWIVTPSGNAFTLDSTQAPEPVDLPTAAQNMLAAVCSGQTQTQVDGDGLFVAATITVGTPVRDDNGSIIAAVFLSSPATGVHTSIVRGFAILIGSMVAALIATLVLAHFLAKGFSQPLAKMETTTSQLMRRDYSARTGITRKDELGSLAAHIDTLALRLQEADAESAQLETLRQAFISNISHELRTPVAVMRGSIEALRDGVVTDEAQVNAYYDQLLTESIHLERMVNDLLELTRLQNPDYTIQKETVNLLDILSDATRASRQLAVPKNIELCAQRQIDVFLFSGDYGRLRQLFVIILDNAIKFSPEGDSITISAKTLTDGSLSVAITDHGPGIAPEMQARIFDRFYKSSDAINAKGTGLGLAIAGQIANRHDAHITVDSRVGGPTTFTLVFPKETPQ